LPRKRCHETELDRIHIIEDGNQDIDINLPCIINNLKNEYLRRFNVCRTKHLFVPLEVKLKNESQFIQEIEKRYSEKGRFYHTLQHLQEFLLWYQMFKDQLDRPREFYYAILFHDIVYEAKIIEPGQASNEQRSIQLAKELLDKFSADEQLDRKFIFTLIECTERHGKESMLVFNNDVCLFVDMDMAILASDDERFWEYTRQIAEEYMQHYSSEEFMRGVIQFQERVLKLKQIFHSKYFFDHCEEKARENIELLIKVCKEQISKISPEKNQSETNIDIDSFFNPELPFLASQAAIELDNILLGRGKGITAVKKLASGFETLLIDPPAASIFSASQAANVQSFEEFVASVSAIAKGLQTAEQQPDTKVIEYLRLFCNNLAKEAIAHERFALGTRVKY